LWNGVGEERIQVENTLRDSIKIISETTDVQIYDAAISRLVTMPGLIHNYDIGDSDDAVWDSFCIGEDMLKCGLDEAARAALVEKGKIPFRRELHFHTRRSVRVRISNLSSDGALTFGPERVTTVSLGKSGCGVSSLSDACYKTVSVDPVATPNASLSDVDGVGDAPAQSDVNSVTKFRDRTYPGG
jgi:hypothetical protein